MNKDRETVCVVVVTYNRKKLLLECLEANSDIENIVRTAWNWYQILYSKFKVY